MKNGDNKGIISYKIKNVKTYHEVIWKYKK